MVFSAMFYAGNTLGFTAAQQQPQQQQQLSHQHHQLQEVGNVVKTASIQQIRAIETSHQQQSNYFNNNCCGGAVGSLNRNSYAATGNATSAVSNPATTGYHGVGGIPKSPSFHSGLDLLADDYHYDGDNSVNDDRPKKVFHTKPNIGLKFKFTNIEEFAGGFFSGRDTMPPLQQQQQQDTNHSSNSSASSTSSSSLSSATSTALTSSTVASPLTTVAATPSTIAATAPTASSLVSTLTQHFNAATSATSLLTSASSSLANHKSPVSAATAIKNILNASKSVGIAACAAANATQTVTGSAQNCDSSNSNPGIGRIQGQNGSIVVSATTTPPNIGSAITAMAGCVVSDGGSCSGNDSTTATSGSAADSIHLKNGSETILSPQTLQQISGSPGRARDRNLFHSPTAAAASSLPLLRGF